MSRISFRRCSLLVILLSLILVISSTANGKLDLSDLTEEENLKLYEELLDLQLASDTSISPEQKQTIQIKWNQIKGLVQEKCQYFQWGTNMTSYLVNTYNCFEAFGHKDTEFNHLSPEEYVSEVCDNDNWKEFVDCTLETTQTFALSFFRCFMGVDYAKPGGSGDSVKYVVLERIPQLLDLLWKFSCDNKNFLMESFKYKEEGKEFQRILLKMKDKKDRNADLRLGLCMIQRNPEITDRTLCETFENLDYKSALACLSEHEDFQSPKAKDVLLKFTPLLKFFTDKNSGGPSKAELLRNVWNDFCAPGSYLSTIFNKRTPRAHLKENDTEKKSSITEENGLFDNILKLGKVNLSPDQSQKIQGELKRLKFTGRKCNLSFGERVALYNVYKFKIYGCLLNSFEFEDYSEEPDKVWAAQEYRDEFCDAEGWNNFKSCALWPTQSLILSEFHCFIEDLEGHIDLDKPIKAAQFIVMDTFPRILDAVWNLLCTQKKALMGTAGLQLKDVVGLQAIVEHIMLDKRNTATQISIATCFAKHSKSMLRSSERSYCEHLAESDYQIGLNCLLDGVDLDDNPAASYVWKKFVPVGKLILDKNEGRGNGKHEFISTAWENLCSNKSPLSVIFNPQTLALGDEAESVSGSRNKSENVANKKNQKTKKDEL